MENQHRDQEIGHSIVHGDPITPKPEVTPHKSTNGHSNNTISSDQDPEKRNIDTTLGGGIQKCFTTASNLGNFLPTGTNLIFSAFLPSIYRNGQCSSLSTAMIIIVLGLFASFCFLSSFTDSFEDNNGEGTKTTIYGIVTTKGLRVYHYYKPLIEDDRYKLGAGDVLHATMSAMVFMVVAFSDRRVIECLFPRHVNDVEQVMQNLVLLVGFVSSTLFLLFPVHRRGFVPMMPKNSGTK